MKIQWNRRYTTIAVYAFLTVAASTLFLGFVFNFPTFVEKLNYLVGILKPFIYGFVIAYLLNPVLRVLEDKVFPRIFPKTSSRKVLRGLSILLTYLFAVACLTVFFWVVIPQIVMSLSSIITSFRVENIQALANWMIEQIPTQGMPSEFYTTLDTAFDDFVAMAYTFVSNLLPFLLNFTMGLTNGFINVLVGIIISIYMFMGKETFFAQCKKALYALFPRERVDWSIALTHESHAIFSGFITGKIIDSLIIGLICFICLSLLKMPYTMLVSVIVGVTNVIPYFGPFFGAVPAFFIILTASPVQALVFLVFVFILQQFDGNILGPKILGESTGLSAFWVIFSIMLFGKIMGFVGMFIGVPLFAVIYSVSRKFVSHRLARKGMPTETKAYASDHKKLLDDKE